jgi:hypothetical protein
MVLPTSGPVLPSEGVIDAEPIELPEVEPAGEPVPIAAMWIAQIR